LQFAHQRVVSDLRYSDQTIRTRPSYWPMYLRQEAQLPQRNSASAAHMEGLSPPVHSPPPLATPMRTVCKWTLSVRLSYS